MADVNQDFTEDIKTYIVINKPLQVRFVDDQNSATYYSVIRDISEGRLVIAWPTRGGTRMLVHRDQILDFSFMHEGAPHEFSGLVDEMSTEPAPQITVIMSTAIATVQRRQNFRVKSMIPVTIGGSIKNAKDGSLTALHIRTIASDISASGMAIVYSNLIPEDTLLEVKLALPDNASPINIPCCAVYSQMSGEEAAMYRIGIRYLAVSESDRARIVRYVYRTQLKSFRL